jgi:hypothetical protein
VTRALRAVAQRPYNLIEISFDERCNKRDQKTRYGSSSPERPKHGFKYL